MELLKEIEKVHNNIKARNLEDAIQRCNKLIKKFPKNPYLYNLGGLALQQLQNITLSVKYFEKAIELEPTNLSAKNNLANSLKVLGKFDISEKLYKEILKNDNQHLKCLNNYANLKQQLTDYAGAIDLYKKALDIEPKHITVLLSLANAYHSIGKFDKAKENINKVLNINENTMSAHKLLSSILDYKSEPEHLQQMKNLNMNDKLRFDQKIDLNFALGKAYEDIGDYENSFKSLEKANEIKRKNIIFDIKNEKNLFESIKKSFQNVDFNKEVKNQRKEKIIFICGMPRSGTTLVEQILAAHKNVSGAGELIYLQQSIRSNFIKNNEVQKDILLEDIFSERVKVSSDYYDLLKLHNFKNFVITDKAPQNFRWIGFIKIFFPNSKIIHCTRNPRDVCLSLYKNSFASTDMNWAYSQEDIAGYFNMYKDLMNFWTSKIEKDVYNINYEKLVSDKENEIKKLLNFCELEFDSSCLNHHKSSNTPIKTVSVTQARKPIYTSSINKNEFYKNNLNKMFSLLD